MRSERTPDAPPKGPARTPDSPPKGPAPPKEPEPDRWRPQRGGKLVRVALASNQAEAEFIQGLLEEEGIPSVLRRTAGFDVPDFLAAGPRDVLVQSSAELDARELLLQAEVISDDPQDPRPVAPLRLLAGILIALAVGALVVWLISLAVS